MTNDPAPGCDRSDPIPRLDAFTPLAAQAALEVLALRGLFPKPEEFRVALVVAQCLAAARDAALRMQYATCDAHFLAEVSPQGWAVLRQAVTAACERGELGATPALAQLFLALGMLR